MSAPAVDAYIAAQPEPNRSTLARIRAVVHAACPDAVDAIAYQMPGFRLRGRLLLSYAGYRRHCALYPASGAVTEALGEELAPFLAEKATIRLTEDRPLPDDLLRRIVELRAVEVGG